MKRAVELNDDVKVIAGVETRKRVATFQFLRLDVEHPNLAALNGKSTHHENLLTQGGRAEV